MLRRFLERRQRPFTCTDVDANVEQVRDGRLSARETAAFKAHVASCNACRQRLKTETAWLSTLQATPTPARLTPTERRAMQQALGRHMRRGIIMRNIRLSVQQVAVVGVLALVVGAMVWWQTAVTPTENLDNTTDSVIENQLNQQDEEITLRFAVEDYELTAYDILIEAFESENPGIRIKLIPVSEILGSPSSGDSSQTNGQLIAQAADVFSSQFIPPSNQEQFIFDLAPFINADPNFFPEDFYSNTLQRINGRIYVLPISINFSLIFYNKDIFDAAGLPYPQPGWSWNDFHALASKLTLRSGDTTTQWGFAKPTSSWSSLFETQLTTPLATAQTTPPTFRFEDDDVMAVAHQYESLFLIEEVALAFADPSLIEEGKVAMWPSHYSSYFSKSVNDNWGAVPYPSTSVIGTNGLVMSSGSRNPDAAWKWISFLSKQGQLVSNSALPARVSVAETNQFWQNAAPEITETMHYALENSRVFQPNPGYEILDDAMNTILRGEKTVEASFSQAQMLAEQLVAGTDASDEEIFPIVVDNTDEGNTSDVTSLTFWLLNDENIQSYRTLADEFEVNARVHINFRFFNSSEEYPNLTTIAQSSDCFRWISLRDNTYQNSVLNLDPLIATDPSVDIIDFFPLAVDQFTAEGQLWGLPADLNPIIIEYNKDLFDAASIPYPSFEWTIDDFLSTAIDLTEGEGQTKQYGFVSDIAELVLLKTMMVQLGAELIDTSKNPPTITFTEPTTIDAMRWYTSLSAEYNVKPLFQIDIIGNRTADYEEYMRLLRRGQAAMWTAYTFPIPTEAKETTNIGAVPLPSGIGNAGIENPGMGYFISASASPQNRQACWQWIKLLTESVDVVQGVPARRSVAESATYAQRVGQAQAAAYLASMGQITTSSPPNSDSALWWMFPYELWLGHAHDQITFNGIPVEEAMAAAQQTFDAYRACVIEKNAFDDRKLQEQCLVEVDPTLAELFNAGGE